MTPLAFKLPYVFVFWGVMAWAFFPEVVLTIRSRRQRTTESSDHGSLALMVFGLAFANAAALPLAFLEVGQFPAWLQLGVFCGGLALVVVGSILRRHCQHLLGSYFTSAVAATLDQPVIERGAYAWVRHPSYSAGILMHLGYGLALGSWASTLLIAAVCIVVYGYRIAIEERLLVTVIGEPYRDYMRGHRRLIPYVY